MLMDDSLGPWGCSQFGELAFAYQEAGWQLQPHVATLFLWSAWGCFESLLVAFSIGVLRRDVVPSGFIPGWKATSTCLLGRLPPRRSFPRVFPCCCYGGSSRALAPWFFKLLGQDSTLNSSPDSISDCLIILWLSEKHFHVNTRGCGCCDLWSDVLSGACTWSVKLKYCLSSCSTRLDWASKITAYVFIPHLPSVPGQPLLAWLKEFFTWML